MKSALTRWAFGAAFGLIVIAVGISITTEQAPCRLVHGDNNTPWGRRLPDRGLPNRQAGFVTDQ